MRAPRYRFPDDVRAATRSIARRMVREDSIAETPAQLATWISGHPEEEARLVKGGYGERFGADDLLPLLHALAGRGGGRAPVAEPPAIRVSPAWIVVLALIAAVLTGVLLGVLS